METLVTSRREQEVILTTPNEFTPVNDEYQPFEPAGRRDRIHEKLAVPLLVKLLGLPQGKRILEIGCGAGTSLLSLARLCMPTRLVGIDIDDFLLRQANSELKTNHVQAELYQEDVRSMPFADASFDIIIDFGTCYHINRRVKAIREIERVLAPDGIFATETPITQIISHPVRSLGKRIPWHMSHSLRPARTAILWTSRKRDEFC